MFQKKAIEEQEMQELTDEQLTQVAGGGLLGGNLVGGVLNTATGTVSSVLDSVPVNVNAGLGANASVAGVNVTAGTLLGVSNE